MSSRGVPANCTPSEFPVALFSGDLPDVFAYDFPIIDGSTRKLSEDLIRHTMPIYSALVDSYDRAAWERWRDPNTGLLSAIPLIPIGLTSVPSVRLRTDWLTKLELEFPTTIQDYTDVLSAFVHGDPDGNHLPDTQGLTAQSGLPSGLTWPTFFAAYGLMPAGTCFPVCGSWIRIDDQTVWSDVSPSYRLALETLANAYADGLIDPEWDTQTRDDAFRKLEDGVVGAWDSYSDAFVSGPDSWKAVPDGLQTEMQSQQRIPNPLQSNWGLMIADHIDDDELLNILRTKESLWTATTARNYEPGALWNDILVISDPKKLIDYNLPSRTGRYLPSIEIGAIAQDYYVRAIQGNVDIAATWDAYVEEMNRGGLDTIKHLFRIDQ